MISLRRPVTGAVLCGALVSALALAGCASSNAPDGTKAAPVTLDTAAPNAANSDAAGAIPAVIGATDTKAKPKIAAGSGAPPSTTLTRDLVPGTGPVATPTSTVTVQYDGALWPTGKDFNSTWVDNSGQPTQFALSQVIEGFKTGIAGMKVGGRREIVIPPSQGYGATANGPVPANATLVFVVDLKAVNG